MPACFVRVLVLAAVLSVGNCSFANEAKTRLSYLGISPEVLAAASVSAAEAESVMSAACGAAEEAGQYETSLTALAVARTELRNAVESRQSNPESGLTADAVIAAELALDEAQSEYNSSRQSLQQVVLVNVSQEVKTLILQLTNSDRLDLPVEYRTLALQADGARALRGALVRVRRMELAGRSPSAHDVALITTADAQPEVATLRASVVTRMGMVREIWGRF